MSFPVEPAPKRRMPLFNHSGAPTPNPAPEGGEVLSAGRARELVAKSRNQPQPLEQIRVSDAVKGSLRRASPALDSALNPCNVAAPTWRGDPAAKAVRRQFHTKRHRPSFFVSDSLARPDLGS